LREPFGEHGVDEGGLFLHDPVSSGNDRLREVGAMGASVWQSRTCATFAVVVTPFSLLQSNW
jgi:hypothetical protein